MKKQSTNISQNNTVKNVNSIHPNKRKQIKDNLHFYSSSHSSSSVQKPNSVDYNTSDLEYFDLHDYSQDTFINSPIYTVNHSTSKIWCYSMTPVHLKGLDIICKIFGRSRYTVKQWVKEGAPIVYNGISYISEYNALFAWLLDRYR